MHDPAPRPAPSAAGHTPGQLLCSKCAAEATHAFDFALYRAAPTLLAFVERVVADAGCSVSTKDGEPSLCGGLDPAILLDEFYRHGRAALAAARGEAP